MLLGKKVLAVVPARSGSKGIKDKNLQKLGAVSLIGLAGICLEKLPWLDGRILSTDSPVYAREGEKYGLSAPFLRPSYLSTDQAGAVETISHATLEAEKHRCVIYDIILIIEPTSPLRIPKDVESAAALLIKSGADSVVTVSELCPRSHPHKVLSISDGLLHFYSDAGRTIVGRQSLNTLYWRNGVCYAMTRACLLENKTIFTDNTLPLVIKRAVVNIDEPIDIDWAKFLVRQNT